MIDRHAESPGARRSRLLAACVGAALVAVVAACGSARQDVPPAGTAQPDKFLFDRGTAALKEEEWANARTYFQQIVDGYPQSPFRPDAKLGLGDAYLGENSAESLVSAVNEFKEFLSFYPTNPRADYAQYKLAMTHFVEMRSADRDQTATKLALAEFEVFFQKFPNSPLMPEVKQNWRIARDRLSESSYRVGLTYYRLRWYTGAIDRFREVLKEDPGYTGRDAVYFYLAESLVRADKTKTPEAIPYLERLLSEFDMSEYLEDAQERLQELKNQ
jgi:outer membrane protein assembly factor BamD